MKVDPHGALVTGFLGLAGLDLPAGLTVEEGQGSLIYTVYEGAKAHGSDNTGNPFGAIKF